MLIKYLIKQEWRLEKIEYRKYLYQKYKVTFSLKTLHFYFHDEAFQLDALMAKLHRIEQDKINLDYYVSAMFICLLTAGYWGVSFLDAYLLAG
jgi:hypothetical protein